MAISNLPFIRSRHDLFWSLLLPASFCWLGITSLRRWYYRRRPVDSTKIRTICCGNIHSGGSGKTPLVLELAQRIWAGNSDRPPIILSRGYRGKLSKGGAKVDLNDPEGVKNFGDEPWLLAKRTGLSVYIGAKRQAMLKKLESEGVAGIAILDDGFQHFPLQKSTHVIAINPSRSPAENFCLPFGELRESISAIRVADAVVLMGEESPENVPPWTEFLAESFPEIPVFRAHKKLEGFFSENDPIELEPGSVRLGFCGLADPSAFRNWIESQPEGFWMKSFPDHHDYRDEDVAQMVHQRISSKDSAIWVTTEKDWFKVSPYFRKRELPLVAARISYTLPEAFWELIQRKMEIPCSV